MASCALAKNTYTCPEKIHLANGQPVVDDTTKSWQSTTTESPLWLTNVGIYDGPVKDNAALMPTEEKGKANKWVFEGDYPQGKFAACEYANGVVKLSQPIEKSATNCIATTKSSANQSGIRAVFMCAP